MYAAKMAKRPVRSMEVSLVVTDVPPERLYEYIQQRPVHSCENNMSRTFDLDVGDPVYGKGNWNDSATIW